MRESDIEHRRHEHQYRVMQFQNTIELGVLWRDAIVYDRENVQSRTKFKQQTFNSFQHPVTQEHTQSSEPFQQPALERNSRHQADVKTTSALPNEKKLTTANQDQQQQSVDDEVTVRTINIHQQKYVWLHFGDSKKTLFNR